MSNGSLLMAGVGPVRGESDPIARVYDVLFQNTFIRPAPADIASLIAHGVDDEAIISAGLGNYPRKPQMEQVLANLEVSLPYIQQISDKLALDHGKDEVLFAGRDAEALYDDFAITYPQVRSKLLPASKPLWLSEGMEYEVLASAFLARHALTEEFAASGDRRCVLVDTGFVGSVGDCVGEQAYKLYGVNLLSTGKLAVKLVSQRSGEKSIIDLHGEDIALAGTTTGDDNFKLAVGLQLMPRYHGPYRFLRPHHSGVIAMAGQTKLNPDLDLSECRTNASLVNPIAAALVQLRVVRSAMERASSATEAVI